MVSKIITWSAAMAWHLGRIATMRPAFEKMSDSARMVWSFMGVYFAAGLLRWVVLAPGPVHFFTVSFKLLLLMVLILAMFERRKRSSALTASVWGVSAVMDLLVSVCYLVGLRHSVMPSGLNEMFIEIVWSVAMVVQFHRAPSVVRKNGYRLAQYPG